MDKVQKHNSFNTNTSSSESYKNYINPLYMTIFFRLFVLRLSSRWCFTSIGNIKIPTFQRSMLPPSSRWTLALHCKT